MSRDVRREKVMMSGPPGTISSDEPADHSVEMTKPLARH